MTESLVSCELCGHPDRYRERYCAHCGHDLARPCASCGADNHAANRFCTGCGLSFSAAHRDELEVVFPPAPPSAGQYRVIRGKSVDL